MRHIEGLPTTEASPDLLGELRGLLDRAFDGGFTDQDWEHTLGGWHVVVRDAGRVVAHAAVVPRRLETDAGSFVTGYVEGVATAHDHRGEGLGTWVMAHLQPVLRDRFELGALSTDRYGFYGRLGWQRWAGPTYVRDGSRLRRTADEDAGVMVLRFGPSAGVDLRSRLVCAARDGDDW